MEQLGNIANAALKMFFFSNKLQSFSEEYYFNKNAFEITGP